MRVKLIVTIERSWKTKVRRIRSFPGGAISRRAKKARGQGHSRVGSRGIREKAERSEREREREREAESIERLNEG